MTLLAGIEGGGTKFFAMIGNDQGEVLHREQFPTTTPEQTMPLVLTILPVSEQSILLSQWVLAVLGH